jgi:hypothetical protein
MRGFAARLRWRGLSIAIVLGLAGCAQSQHASMSQAADAGGATSASLTGGPASPGALALGTIAPASLLGLDRPAVQHLLGEPGLVRRDDPAEVWQYRSRGCVLDVYFYPDRDRLTVAHAEARAPTIAGEPQRPCIATLAELKHGTTG